MSDIFIWLYTPSHAPLFQLFFCELRRGTTWLNFHRSLESGLQTQVDGGGQILFQTAAGSRAYGTTSYFILRHESVHFR